MFGYQILNPTDRFNTRRFFRVLLDGEPVALFLSVADAEEYIQNKKNK